MYVIYQLIFTKFPVEISLRFSPLLPLEAQTEHTINYTVLVQLRVRKGEALACTVCVGQANGVSAGWQCHASLLIDPNWNGRRRRNRSLKVTKETCGVGGGGWEA